MPRVKEHDKITSLFLGWNIKVIHRVMDYAVRILGPKHQVIMHDLKAVKAMELLFGRKGKIVACMHILEDLEVIK